MKEWIIDEDSIDHNDLLSARCANKAYPLVRCKDCKHYDSFSQSCRDGIDGIMTPDFYCANGERK